MKLCYTILLILFSVLLFASCGKIDAITIAESNTYYNCEAVIAYDVYSELYNNKVIDNKPILIKKKER